MPKPKPVDLERLTARAASALRRMSLVDVVAIVRTDLPALVAELQAVRGLIAELRNCLPLPPIGGDPEWLADLRRRSADAAEGGEG